MTKNDITAFRSVARLKSFTKAAAELFIPQPSLSKKIANLEKEIGVILLERSKRSVKLTNAGKIFLQESESLLAQEEEILESVRNAAKFIKHSLHVTFMGAALAEKFLHKVIKFQENFPEYELHFAFMDFRDIYSALKNQQTDLAVTGDLGLLTLDNIRTQKIFNAYSNLILPNDHFWLKTKKRDFADLKTEKFILLDKKISPKGYEKVLEICAGFGFTPQVDYSCRSVDEIFFHIQMRQGISVLPDFDCPPPEMLNLTYIPIKNAGQSFPIVAAWNKSDKNPGISLFKNILIA